MFHIPTAQVHYDARRRTRCALLFALWLAGCRSYAGNPNQSLLPPSWITPTVVASAPPVVYQEAVMPLAPRPSHPYSASSQPSMLIAEPPALPAPALPPAVPPADLQADPVIDDATRSLIDDLNRRIDGLQQELEQQRTELDAARSESAAARQAAEQIAAEMQHWRQELAQVRIALQQQQADDLQALDAINDTLREILSAEAAAEEPQPDALPIPADVAAREIAPTAGTRR